MPEKINTSGQYTNRLNISNISKGGDETPSNLTFDLQRQKNKADLYDELLKKHMGRTATSGVNPFKASGLDKDKVTRVSSAIQRDNVEKLNVANKTSAKKVYRYQRIVNLLAHPWSSIQHEEPHGCQSQETN